MPRLFLLFACFVAASAAPVFAQQVNLSVPVRIAYFSPSRVFAESSDGKAATARLSALESERAKEAQDKNVAIEKMERTLQQGAAVLSETARVQREIIEYAKLNQSTLQSAKVITESLGYLKGLPDAVRAAEPPVEEVANEERAESEAEAVEQPSADDGTSGDQAREPAADQNAEPERPDALT